ncbi:hypothetical protein LJC04_00015 [Ruminococcaceae bacterium OttesenSCG-928-O06]|nr:hypothetical protein [Ruminococcaceae bacterium OttesenSCG-928-O06]
MARQISEETRKLLVGYQQSEETDHVIYARMAKREKNEENRQVLQRIADEEKDHAAVWKRYTGATVGPARLRVFWYTLMGYIMGYTFVIKLMEKGEYTTSRAYQVLLQEIPEAKSIIDQEQAHEDKLADIAGRGAPAVCGGHGTGAERRPGRAYRHVGRAYFRHGQQPPGGPFRHHHRGVGHI